MFLPEDTRFWIQRTEINGQPGKCPICEDYLAPGEEIAKVEWKGPPSTCWSRAHINCARRSPWNIDNQPTLDLDLDLTTPADHLGIARTSLITARHALSEDSNASRGRLAAITAVVEALESLVLYAETLRRTA